MSTDHPLQVADRGVQRALDGRKGPAQNCYVKKKHESGRTHGHKGGCRPPAGPGELPFRRMKGPLGGRRVAAAAATSILVLLASACGGSAKPAAVKSTSSSSTSTSKGDHQHHSGQETQQDAPGPEAERHPQSRARRPS